MGRMRRLLSRYGGKDIAPSLDPTPTIARCYTRGSSAHIDQVLASGMLGLPTQRYEPGTVCQAIKDRSTLPI